MLTDIMMFNSYTENKKNWIGHKFGKNCIVIAYVGYNHNRKSTWLIRCACGREFKTLSSSFKTIKGCKKCAADTISRNKRKDITGYQWNGCEVLRYGYRKNGKNFWLVRCKCDKEFFTNVVNIIGAKPIQGCKKCGYQIASDKKSKVSKGLKFGDNSVVIDVNTDKPVQYGARYWNCVCGTCGKSFITSSRSILDKEEPVQGCLECGKKRNRRYGKNHHNWNHNLTKDERWLSTNRMAVEGYCEFHSAVLKMADYQCDICQSNKNLVVHHLDGWHWCKDRRTDVANGVTLCSKCHNLFHKLYGRKNNEAHEFFTFKLCYGDKKCR